MRNLLLVVLVLVLPSLAFAQKKKVLSTEDFQPPSEKQEARAKTARARNFTIENKAEIIDGLNLISVGRLIIDSGVIKVRRTAGATPVYQLVVEASGSSDNVLYATGREKLNEVIRVMDNINKDRSAKDETIALNSDDGARMVMIVGAGRDDFSINFAKGANTVVLLVTRTQAGDLRELLQAALK